MGSGQRTAVAAVAATEHELSQRPKWSACHRGRPSVDLALLRRGGRDQCVSRPADTALSQLCRARAAPAAPPADRVTRGRLLARQVRLRLTACLAACRGVVSAARCAAPYLAASREPRARRIVRQKRLSRRRRRRRVSGRRASGPLCPSAGHSLWRPVIDRRAEWLRPLTADRLRRSD